MGNHRIFQPLDSLFRINKVAQLFHILTYICVTKYDHVLLTIVMEILSNTSSILYVNLYSIQFQITFTVLAISCTKQDFTELH